MGKIIKSILYLFFVLLITSYAFCQENRLIGKWEVVEGNSKLTFEFFEDNTCTISYPNKIISKGTYKLINDNQVAIKLMNLAGEEKNQNFDFFISDEGLLKLSYVDEKDPKNYFYTVYKRVK